MSSTSSMSFASSAAKSTTCSSIAGPPALVEGERDGLVQLQKKHSAAAEAGSYRAAQDASDPS